MDTDNENFNSTQLSNFLQDTSLLEREREFNLEDLYADGNKDYDEYILRSLEDIESSTQMQNDSSSTSKAEPNRSSSSQVDNNESVKRVVSDDVELAIFEEIEKIPIPDEMKDDYFIDNHLVDDNKRIDGNEDEIDLLIDDNSNATDVDNIEWENEDLQPYDVASNHMLNIVKRNEVKLMPNSINIMDIGYEHRGTTLEEDRLILFQQTLNGKLEHLLQTMKNTEQSRNLLATHPCSSLNNLISSPLRQNSLQNLNQPSSEPLVPHLSPLGMPNHHGSLISPDTNKVYYGYKNLQKNENPSLMKHRELKRKYQLSRARSM